MLRSGTRRTKRSSGRPSHRAAASQLTTAFLHRRIGNPAISFLVVARLTGSRLRQGFRLRQDYGGQVGGSAVVLHGGDARAERANRPHRAPSNGMRCSGAPHVDSSHRKIPSGPRLRSSRLRPSGFHLHQDYGGQAGEVSPKCKRRRTLRRDPIFAVGVPSKQPGNI